QVEFIKQASSRALVPLSTPRARRSSQSSRSSSLGRGGGRARPPRHGDGSRRERRREQQGEEERRQERQPGMSGARATGHEEILPDESPAGRLAPPAVARSA